MLLMSSNILDCHQGVIELDPLQLYRHVHSVFLIMCTGRGDIVRGKTYLCLQLSLVSIVQKESRKTCLLVHGKSVW